MSLTIGRATFPRNESTLQWSGDDLTITGFISPTTVNDVDHANALRAQLNGLGDSNDDDVISVTSSTDPNIDGFYRVLNIQVSGEPTVMNVHGVMPYVAQLRRVAGGFSKPSFETMVTSVVRTNAHSVVSPVGPIAAYFAPSAYTYADIDTSSLTLVGSATLTTSDGSVVVKTATAPVATDWWRHFVQPADYYSGGARVEVQYGSTWYPIHGLHLPSGTAGKWRISNGYCRLYPSSVGGQGRFTVETYRTGSWVGREFMWGVFTTVWVPTAATGDATGLVTPSILVNTPNMVVIRSPISSYIHDFVIRRGDTWIEATALSPAVPVKWGIAPSTSIASTSFTGGIRATGDDANGLRFLTSAGPATTKDTGTGALYATSTVNTMTIQVTADYQVGVATTDTTVRDLFYAARSDRQKVVAR